VKYFISLFLMGLLVMAAQFGPQFVGQGTKIYRYSIQTEMKSPLESGSTITWLRDHDFDIAGINWQKKQIEVITHDEGLALLNQNHFVGRILEEQILGSPSRLSFDSQYLNPEKVEAKLQALRDQFPQLTRLEKLGTSAQGRAIWGLLISTTPQAQDDRYFEKPTVIIDGLHHAREIMTPEVVMDVAETFLQTPSAQSNDLLSRWNIWLVPMLNVDGSNLVWTKNPWWRKNVLTNQGSIYGVDVNRNYPYKWAACNGSSDSTSNDTYHGPSAGSEAETQALVKLGQATIPTAYLSYHSYSELVLYPYGCMNDVTGEAQLHDKIGHELAQILPSDSNDGSFYTPGPPWQILYGVDGDSMSYMHAEFGATAFSFEINQEFQPDYALRQPTIEKHRKAWSYFLNRIDQNLLTLNVVDGKTGKPAAATVDISTIALIKGEKPFHTNSAGNFFKVLDPGSYNLRVHLADGRQKDLVIQMAGHAQTQTVTVN
jgi:hypothetical protein